MLTVDQHLANDDWTKLSQANVGGQNIDVPMTPMQTGLVIAELRRLLELQRRAIVTLHAELELLKAEASGGRCRIPITS